MNRTSTRMTRSAFALASMLLLGNARAQSQSTEDLAAAEALFRQARELLDAGRTEEACRKFEESYRLDPAPGTLLNTAHCHQMEGKIATAWAQYHQVAAEARHAGRAEREKVALEAIEELEPRLPALRIVVPSASRIEGLQVFRNGSPLGRAAWGTPTPVDPGRVTIEAKAPGYKTWTHKVDVAEGGKAEVAIPMLEKLPDVPKPPPVQPDQPAGPPPDLGSPTQQTAGLAMGAVGLVGVGVGSYFGIRAINKRSESDDNCPVLGGQEYCNQSGVDDNLSAQTAARVANFGIGLGIVALVAGTYLYLDGAPSGPPERAAEPKQARPPVDVAVTSRNGGGFVSLAGEW